MRRAATTLAVVLFAALAAGQGVAPQPARAATGPTPLSGPLSGVFSITPGTCNPAGPPAGSYVELEEHGLPLSNPSSPCPLTSSIYTPLKAGTVGLVSGAYQNDPVPTFDANGDSLANAIATPVKFLGVGFGVATTCADQQHHPTPTGACPNGTQGFPTPQLSVEPAGTGGCALTNGLNECLYGNLEGFGATYNGTANGTCTSGNGTGCYDLGVATGSSLQVTSCGSAPVGGCSLLGSLSPVTHAYSLDLHSTIVGTSFNGAIAVFHLSGTYTPGIPKQPGSSPPPSGPGGSPPPSSGGGSSPPPASGGGVGGHAMSGVFHISAGTCNGSGAPSGSWIQLSLGGSPVKNSNSACAGGSYTPLSQGTTGLTTGQFQPNPAPTFDSAGNSLAASLIQPTMFLGTKFGAATNPQNEQSAPSGPAVFPAPQAVLNGTTISANLSAVNFTYNGPANGTCASGNGDGCYAVGSSNVSGTYDPSTHAYVIGWTGTIHGGAFNNATATFHLVGLFAGTIAATTTTLTPQGGGSSGGSPPGTMSAGSSAALTSVGSSGAPRGPQANEMAGTFTVAAGVCNGSGAPSGSWIQLGKGGSPIPNTSSSCAGGDYTPIVQGTTGLTTGRYQLNPTPTFDSSGNSLANAIIRPTKFLGTAFGTATDPQNEQASPNGPSVFPAPYAILDRQGTAFTANLSAINFTYNGSPNGTCSSGNGVGCYAVGSSNVAGTYNSSTHAYSMSWTATVVGGAFNGATASFHLTGTFDGTITKVNAAGLSQGGKPGAGSAAGTANGSNPTVTFPTIGGPSSSSLPGGGLLPVAEGTGALTLAGAGTALALLGERKRIRLVRLNG